MKLKNNSIKIIGVILAGLLLASSCSRGKGSEVSQTPIPSLPTPTSAPMAVMINGEGILLSYYTAEMQRNQSAVEQLGNAFDPALAKEEVVNYLVAQTVIAQAAAAQGFSVSDADVQAKVDQYAEELGGQETLTSWMTENYYDLEGFKAAVARDLMVTWMRNYLIDQVPLTAEQVRARQILVDNENEAIGIQRQLQAGTSFKELAFQYDPLTGGELGWFPRGYLLQPDVDNAAFAVQAGQFSAIIPTSYGFHIIEVIETDPQHTLTQDALMFMQRQAVASWLETQLAQSTVEILVP